VSPSDICLCYACLIRAAALRLFFNSARKEGRSRHTVPMPAREFFGWERRPCKPPTATVPVGILRIPRP